MIAEQLLLCSLSDIQELMMCALHRIWKAQLYSTLCETEFKQFP